MKKHKQNCRKRVRPIVITEAMLHRAFRAVGLEECRKWMRGVGEARLTARNPYAGRNLSAPLLTLRLRDAE